MRDHPFWQTLIKQQILSAEAALAAAQSIDNTAPVTWLIQQQMVDAEQLANLLANYLSLPSIDLDLLDERTINLNALPESLIREQQILPLQPEGNRVPVIIADPCRPGLLQEISVRLNQPVAWHIGAYDKLAKCIARVLHSQARENLTDDAPVVRYVEKLLLDAVTKQASDIHIEHYTGQLRIRLRIDGIMLETAQLPQGLAERLIAHLKILAQLDITERRLPQDGRLQILLAQGRAVDCRLSTCPTVHGEKLVLRLLNTAQASLDIDSLGFSSTQKALFLEILHKPQGLILVTGPTGSGKTVTLYTALHLLNQPGVNISSVEDPVEIDLPGINQVPVNPKIGLTFAKVLRAFLRQDPDILMIGEMRDHETAEIAIKAAQTGHLVLSTLHTNSAAETLARLLNMEIPAYHIAASVSLIIAQRLVRCLCHHCRQPEGASCYRAVGCTQCQNGYSGRTAIYECLPVTTIIAEKILQHCSASALEACARDSGMVTLYESGLEKVRAGMTSMAEIIRVTR